MKFIKPCDISKLTVRVCKYCTYECYTHAEIKKNDLDLYIEKNGLYDIDLDFYCCYEILCKFILGIII